ncbi:MAG: UDP-N-acetylmuramate dehydrogenase [Lachnospiraceae bacterium]|nr:UDP-N-acetylmuramate dehydrogenase [Lachnospiraceae bacterium]
MDQDILAGLCKLAGREHVYQDEPLCRHTTFRIGGPADFFVTPDCVSVLEGLVAFCREREVPFYILGNGSNLLVGDKGYRGVIIQLCKNLNQIKTADESILAQAGAMLSAIARAALEEGLTGLEFASGIPGTLGGAVMMNAGAYGGEMKNVVRRVRVLSREGEILELTGEQMEFGYRTSAVEKEKYIVLEAELGLRRGDREQISACMKELQERRVEKQPLNMPSAGSTFKRPEGYFAGKLIMDAGLRGFSVGGAQISEKHCGFVINKGGATAADVRELMRQVNARVQEKFGVSLEPEVKMLGEF